jgi:Glycosyl hydrolase family 71
MMMQRLRNLLLIVALCGGCAGPVRAAPAQAGQQGAVPLLAYYYIWYTLRSWDRAKIDLPLLGPYSSDDRAIMRQHVRWAKRVGINGFIVSWKSTAVLNRRLERLIEVAEAEDFKLVIIYQGLDFERRPLPVSQIANDLDYFIGHFADKSVFNLFARPLVIWSGTWEFSPAEVEQVTASRRSPLLMLASERNLPGYARLKHAVDGNAYYWSSVNPETYDGYEQKLDAMGQAVHAENGLWIAPAAPGFDARLIGGTRVVERKEGETLRQQMNAAAKSLPDAIGLISWNEYSENSHIEPSRTYGEFYLTVVSEIRYGPSEQLSDFDSSMPAETSIRPGNVVLLGGLGLLLVVSLIVIARRDLRKKHATPSRYSGPP